MYVKFCRLFLTPILKTYFPSTTTLFLLHIFIFLLFLNISNISLTIELVLYYIIHIIPPNNLEFYWYRVWNVVLSYWFESRFLVVPQYEISYELINRDDNTIRKYVKPDFVLTKYSYENDTFNEHIQLIVEIKRSSNDPKKDFKSISKQLDKTITTLFTKG